MNLSYRYRNFDWVLFGAMVLLIGFGLVVLFSTSLSGPNGAAIDLSKFWRQAAFAILGLLVSLMCPWLDYRYLAHSARVVYVLGLTLLLAVLLIGSENRGTTGWFNFLGFGIQPVELVKLLLIVFLSRYFADMVHERGTWRPIVGSGLAFGLVFVLVLAQPDFGSAILLLAVWGGLLLLSGLRRGHVLLMGSMALLAMLIAWFMVLQPYQKDRVLSFLEPTNDPLGRNYNVTQSVIAVGSGGFFGRGLGYGSQGQLRFLPERQTDFIVATAAEELGFVGMVIVLGLFATFFFRIYRLAMGAHDDFSLFLILGIAIAFFVELIVNVGGALRLLPLTGVTLPFLSYGGSSLLAKCLMVGVLESVAVRRAGG